MYELGRRKRKGNGWSALEILLFVCRCDTAIDCCAVCCLDGGGSCFLEGWGREEEKNIECTALEELQVLMTIRTIHQNQDLPYLFTNLQLLCDGLIADSWLYGEDKAFRGRTVLICSAEQADRLSSLQRNRQLTHPPPSAKQENSQAFLNGRKTKRKPAATYWALLFLPCPSNSAHLLTQVLQTPFDRILQSHGSSAPLLSRLAQREQSPPKPATTLLVPMLSVSMQLWKKTTFLLWWEGTWLSPNMTVKAAPSQAACCELV